jgi:hypothetical protein
VGNRGLGGNVVKSPVKGIQRKIDIVLGKRIPTSLISGILIMSIYCNSWEMEVFENE